MRIWLRILGALFALFAAQAFAQTTHSLYLDTDADSATGCSVVTSAGTVTGAEVRISATVDGSPPVITTVSRSTCNGGVFGSSPAVPAGHPVGLNLGIDVSDVVEFSTSLAGLGAGGAVPAVFVSSDGTSADLVRASIVLPAAVAGGGGQEGGPVAVPGLGGLALLLLTGLIVWRVWRHPGMGATLVVMVMIGFMGVAWAANFVSDGRIQDWSGVPALAASPASNGAAGVDIRRVFGATEGGRLHLRLDVRDLGNPDDPVVPVVPPGPSGNHAPVLLAATFSVNANSPNGTVVGTVVATDVDVGQTLTYAITGGTGLGAFTINPGTGLITVTNSAAINQSLTVVVTVSDSGIPSRSASATFNVAVQGSNRPPTLSAATFVLNENSAAGAVVGTVSGSDPDGNTLTYVITSGNVDNAFAINSSTGVITVDNAAAIDYEVNPNFTLVVTVSDNGSPSLDASATFTINLQDVTEAPIDVGAFQLNGSCGALSLGVLATGFDLKAGAQALPVGTTVTINGTGLASVGVFSVTGGLATVSVLSPTQRQITLTSALPAGNTINLRTLLSVNLVFSMAATATLPVGYVGTGSKPVGGMSGTLIFCGAS